MSNVINFLERMGQDARLREATETELRREMALVSISEASQSAIVDKKPADLAELLKVEKNVCCMIYPVDECA